VCTNKREYLSKKLLVELGLQHYFHSIAGRDTFAVSKPDPGHLTQVIAQAGGVPSRAIMVGTRCRFAPPSMQASPRSW
jgi:phosphoglycolate phosphatase